jgi:hypothetical protein
MMYWFLGASTCDCIMVHVVPDGVRLSQERVRLHDRRSNHGEDSQNPNYHSQDLQNGPKNRFCLQKRPAFDILLLAHLYLLVGWGLGAPARMSTQGLL